MNNTKLAIILIAGESKRLRPLTNNIPKCLVEVAGKTILENTLDILSSHGCKRVILVVGYRSDKVHKLISNKYARVQVEYIENNVYDSTNSMYSLKLGLKNVNEPVWVIEGDIFMDGNILLQNFESDISWFVDSTARDIDGAFLTDDGSGYAKDLNIIRDFALLQPDQYKSVGMLHLNQQGVLKVKSWLDEGVKKGLYNVYYDLIMADHIKDERIKLIDVAGNRWFEIDTIADLESARRMFQTDSRIE